jgi:putative DNA primase/helicase
MKIGRVLYDAGAARSTLVAALAERDASLGYEKYTNRSDADEQYERIADVLESEGRNPRLTVGVGSGAKTYPQTDLGNAERMADQHAVNVRYVPDWKRFIVWDGGRWVMDGPEHLAVKKLAQLTVRSMYAEVAAIEDEERRKALAKYARGCESDSKLRSMVNLLKSQPGVAIDFADLDRDPWLFNVHNGTLNLRTGELQPHDRGDLITKLADVDYNPDATSPTFDAFLHEILPTDTLRGFMQRVIDYSLNGTQREHKLPILHGTGANGKGTLLNIILDVVGDYGIQAADELLMSGSKAHPTDKADLFGKRFVVNQGTEEGQRLNESLIKRLTGGDRIRARRMNENFWEFQPSHTLLLATNHKPVVRSGGNSVWRRLRLVPFTEEIPEHKQDQALPDKLRNELPGILAWAVRGHMDWLQQGSLGEPEEVTAATSEYRNEQDALGRFIEEMCVEGPEARVKAADLHESYRDGATTTARYRLSPENSARSYRSAVTSGGA